MNSKKELMEKELDELINKGKKLLYSMADEEGILSEEDKDYLKEKKMPIPNFKNTYDSWYTEALVTIKQLLPDRVTDFIAQYKNEKRKDIDFLTYTISDYLCGLITRRGGSIIADGKAAIPKMQIQCSILESAKNCFSSTLFDIKEILQADLFDTELKTAEELVNKGFVRGGGAIAGVVLEKHLYHICDIHNFKMTKKTPTLFDYYEALKSNNIIDTAMWRFIQHLGDLRNLCDHHKKKEPTKEEVLDLISGTEKVIKKVW